MKYLHATRTTTARTPERPYHVQDLPLISVNHAKFATAKSTQAQSRARIRFLRNVIQWLAISIRYVVFVLSLPSNDSCNCV